MMRCAALRCLPGQEWRAGPYEVSNAAHPTYTQLTIRGEPTNSKPGYVLELSSALAAIGATVQQVRPWPRPRPR